MARGEQVLSVARVDANRRDGYAADTRSVGDRPQEAPPQRSPTSARWLKYSAAGTEVAVMNLRSPRPLLLPDKGMGRRRLDVRLWP